MENKNEQLSAIRIMVAGLIMGMAEVIPGVSGGTVAFVAGIYERLILAINGVSRIPRLLFRGKWQEALVAIDFPFLWKLMLAMALGVVIGVMGITYLLDHYPAVIWGLFFGLVVGSIIYMGRKVVWRDTGAIILMLLAAILAWSIGALGVGAGNEALWYVFVCGSVAIVALVLPGISGSFLLLLMGMYTFIVKDNLKGLLTDFSLDKVAVMLVFAGGCLVGLLSIARVLKWAFDQYTNRTIATLTGFMMGALFQIWPWRNPVLWMNKETGEFTIAKPLVEFKVVKEMLVLPKNYIGEPYLILSIVAMMVGVGIILWMDHIERAK